MYSRGRPLTSVKLQVGCSMAALPSVITPVRLST